MPSDWGDGAQFIWPLTGGSRPPFVRLRGQRTDQRSTLGHVYVEGSVPDLPLAGEFAASLASPGCDSYEIHEAFSNDDAPVQSGGAIAAGALSVAPNSNARLPGGYHFVPETDGEQMSGGMYVVRRNVSGVPNPTSGPDDGIHLGIAMRVGARRVPGQYNHILDPANTIDLAEAEAALLVAHHRNADPVRPAPMLGNFAYYEPGVTPNVSAWVTRAYAAGITEFESTNEPALKQGPGAWFKPVVLAFRDEVKAGNAAAKVVGPAPVNFTPHIEGQMDALYDAEVRAAIDVDSLHFYNGYFDLPSALNRFDAFDLWRARNERTGKPMRWTEGPSEIAAAAGAGTYGAQAQLTMLGLMAWIRIGGMPESAFMYMLRDVGNPYPSYYSSEFGNPTPVVAALFELAAQLRGCYPTREANLDFGTIGNLTQIGHVHRRPNETGTAAIMSCGLQDVSMSLEVTAEGSMPSSLTVRDFAGRVIQTMSVSGGVATLAGNGDRDMLPRYVELPAGVTVAPATDPLGFGSDRSSADGRAWFGGSGPVGVQPTKAVRGTATNGRIYDPEPPGNIGDARSIPQSADTVSPETPVTLYVQAGAPRPINGVFYLATQSWQEMASPTHATIEVHDGASWVEVAEWERQPKAIVRKGSKQTDGDNGYVAWLSLVPYAFREPIDHATRDRVAVILRGATWGSAPDEDAFTGYDLETPASVPLATAYNLPGVEPRMQVLRAILYDTTGAPDEPVEVPRKYVVIPS